MSFDFTYPTPLPSTKGWGSGWPNCQRKARTGTSSLFFPGVHEDIAELVGMLVAECSDRGFSFLSPGCWGYGCRATKAASGVTGATPSFHSWGLGLDVNAPLNVFGADRENTQLGKPENAWFVALWKRYGFFWLGPDIGDWMHFSFCGSPTDAVEMTNKAKEELMQDPRVDQMIRAAREFWKAWAAAGGDPGAPPSDEPALFREFWNYERRGATNPKGGSTGGLNFGDTVKLMKP